MIRVRPHTSELLAKLPSPPAIAKFTANKVWIIEWLPTGEPHTGRSLHDWMEERRPGWSEYFSCINKAAVIEAIAQATGRAQNEQMIPVLHIEAHGNDTGLEGPDGKGGKEFLTWQALNMPLQQLNIATRCNLLVAVAACTGFAVIQALTCGPRAPALAVVGPEAPLTANELLWGFKEFYRRFQDDQPWLHDIVASASREAGAASFEWESFTAFTYEALTEHIIRSVRPNQHFEHLEKLRQRMLTETYFPVSEIESRLADLSLDNSIERLQQIWDAMFMFDLYPENRARFNLNVSALVKLIDKPKK